MINLKILLAIVLCVVLSGIVSHNVAAQYIPQSVINFEESSGVVDVSPGSLRVKIFNGTMTSSCDSGYTIELEVNTEKSSIPEGWQVAVSPTAVRHPAGRYEDDISVIVKALPLASDKDFARIEIQSYVRKTDWTLNYYGGAASVTVGVNPYVELCTKSKAPYMEIKPGKITCFTLTIENLGNFQDNYEIEIINIGEFPKWVIEPETPTVGYIEPKSSADACIKIVTPRDWILWTDTIYKIQVKVVSTASEQMVAEGEIEHPVVEYYNLYLRLRGTYIPGFDISVLLFVLIFLPFLYKKLKC